MRTLASTEMKVEEGGSGLPIANCAGQRDMRSLVCHAVILSAAERSEESRSGLFRRRTARAGKPYVRFAFQLKP
jgi:hypothetical protein